MAGSKYDQLDIQRAIAEGEADSHLKHTSTYGNKNGAVPNFLRMVILDVISDPGTLDDAKLSHYEHNLKVANIKYAGVAPRNSIIARRVMGGDAGASEKVLVLYPFFPPHMSLPAKVGEHVWAMFEHPDAKVNDIGYWFCRIVEPHFVEDVNHTHSNRQFDPSFAPGIAAVFSGKDDAKYEFSNGAVDSKDGERYVVAGTATIPGDEKSYETLLKDSDASKLTKYESVPRYRKRPADIAFEGSNNTLIVLGTDRTGPIADYDADPDKGKIPKPVKDDLADDGIGVIDLVAGRGQTETTGGKSQKNKLKRKELGKSKKDLADFKNDRSRILIAQKTKVDKNFGLDTVVTAHTLLAPPPVKDASGEGAIVIKTDKIRLVARHDVVILVSGATESDDNGNVKDPGVDVSKCASIILKANGDIIFTPSDTGLIRLGGADAALSPLCTTVSRVPGMPGVPKTGLPPPPPIVSSMGGATGAKEAFGDLNGTFATRVLLK